MRLAIDDAGRGEWEAAMLHACNEVGAAEVSGFVGACRSAFHGASEGYADILGRLGLPGVDVVLTEFPIRLTASTVCAT